MKRDAQIRVRFTDAGRYRC